MAESTYDKQSIVERIRKIMETSGRTEAEKLTAQKLCQKLMMRYNIEDKEIFVSDGDIGINEVENTFEGHETRYWTWDLLQAIATPYNVRIIKTQKRRPITFERYEIYRLVGSKDDRDMVTIIFNNILPVIRSSRKLRWKEYQKITHKDIQVRPATYAKSYFAGYVCGLYEKLQAEREDFLKDMEQNDPGTAEQKSNAAQLEMRLRLGGGKVASITNTDLALYGSNLPAAARWALIVARKREMVDEFIEHEIPNLGTETPRESKKRSHNAYESGFADGKQRYHGRQLGNEDLNTDDVEEI
jgi:hypothetical protein